MQPHKMATKPAMGARRSHIVALLLVPWLALSCTEKKDPTASAPGKGESETAQASKQPAPAETELVVFAAASLRDAFEAMGEKFRQEHRGVQVTFNFAGSQELRTQIEHGAPADVFAAANQEHIESLAAQNLAQPAVEFAENQLVVVVPKGAKAVSRFEDLPAAERIVIGVPEVPVGKYTREVLAKASAKWPEFESKVMARVVSQELNVRQVLAKVALGEADAAIVYRTDAASAPDKVDAIPIPPELNVTARYPIAVLTKAPHPELAAKWVAYVRSPAGQEILTRFGFTAPGAAVPGSAGTQP